MKLYTKDVTGILSSIATLLAGKKDALTELDSEIGDGDLGRTMASGFKAALESFEGMDEGADLSAMITEAGLSMADRVPSTMGTLLSLGIIRAAREIKGSDSIDGTAFLSMLRAAVAGIEERSKARPGDKTLLDALVPATEAFSGALANGGGFPQCIEAASAAAWSGVEASRPLKAVYGKAAAFGQSSIGKQDAGATAVAFVFDGIRLWFDAERKVSPRSVRE